MKQKTQDVTQTRADIWTIPIQVLIASVLPLHKLHSAGTHGQSEQTSILHGFDMWTLKQWGKDNCALKTKQKTQ